MKTQAVTGSTTGDWLVKFYAPWCSHCKRLEPVWEEVAAVLKNDPDNYVNVARVDCNEHKQVGSRFDIAGFPTIKMISKGKMYEYRGKKDVGEIVKFAQGDFKFEKDENVPADLGLLGDVIKILNHAYSTAIEDYNAGNYFTKDVLLISMPFLFIFSMFVLIFLPVGPRVPSKKDRKLRVRKKNDLAEPDDDTNDITALNSVSN